MREKRIITFGLTEQQNAIVNEQKPHKDYEIFDTDAPTDIIAIGSVAMIIQASKLDEDSVGFICDYYLQINGCTDETVVWIGEPKPPRSLHSFFKCYNSFEEIEDKLKYILLNAHSKTKKASDYSERLAISLKILSLIRKHPGITTQKLAEETSVTVRSVQRYIAALQTTGEWIEYDRTKRGWKLLDGVSILFGDVWNGGHK